MRLVRLLKNILSYLLVVIILTGFNNFVLAQVDTLSQSKRGNHFRLNELKNQLDDIFNDPNFSNANWGVFIKSLKTGEIIYKKNENKLFIPASVMKLFTSSSSLLLLGANYNYKTKIYTNGNIKGSILEGDLIIKGVGDPTFFQ